MSRGNRASALCALSALLLALQAWNIALWNAAASVGVSQAEHVAYYLAHAPLSLGRLGAIGLTLLSIAAGSVAVAAALLAKNHASRTTRVACIILATVNGLLVAWYVFTLM